MSYCFIIPNYNHASQIRDVIEEISAFGLPIIMVNDASSEQVREVLLQTEQEFPLLTVLHHEVNQGKGGAVQTGLKYAFEQGFTNAVQVDADGQHCLDDLTRLIEISKAHPQDLISGAPVYDDSVPKHRYWARYITHFWVMIESLSLTLKDSMCGFRVYPLDACMKLMSSVQLGKRMDFDIEIMVRLYWQGVNVRFMDTKVIYPEDGISHFRAFEDNVLISWMHTRLFFGMLIRSPKLIYRNLKRCLT